VGGGAGLPFGAVKRPALPVAVAVLAAALVALLVYGVATRGQNRSLDDAVAAGKLPQAPGLSLALPRLDGAGTTTVGSLRGKVVVLNFWASWCGPCAQEAPLLERAQQQLADRHAGTVLGVTYKDFAGDSRAFARQHRLTYPSLRDDKLALAPKFGTTALPETFVLDPRGRVVALSRGEVTQAFLDRAIARAQAS
jgi:cytochrome c biogenesis protein CcmG/thiol:disulfide interchange protein DsbE